MRQIHNLSGDDIDWIADEVRNRFPSDWSQDTLLDIQLAVQQVLKDTRVKRRYRITAEVEEAGPFEALTRLRTDLSLKDILVVEVDPELKSGSQ